MREILLILDYLGTVAFAISGALIAIRRKMDLFGVIVLAMVTATGGGVLRDISIGITPPASFRNPTYILIATITGLITFLFLYCNPHLPRQATRAYDFLMFLFDTLGVAAFTVDGIVIGVAYGHAHRLFLLVFLGVITGVGGGVLRDILAAQMPDILVKHVYALASILGALVTVLLIQHNVDTQISMIAGFLFIVLLRVLAVRFHWNLPRIPENRS